MLAVFLIDDPLWRNSKITLRLILLGRPFYSSYTNVVRLNEAAPPSKASPPSTRLHRTLTNPALPLLPRIATVA